MRPRIIRCVETDAVIEYVGYGRPPKYAPGVRKRIDAQRRRDKRAAAAQAKRERAV
jgi:hypothetical protein